MTFRMIGTKIQNIELENELDIAGQINLSANYHTDISVNPDNQKEVLVVAHFSLEGTSENNDDSFLKFKMIYNGLFEASSEIDDSDDIKDDIHADMFPYIRAYVSAITSLAGLPPITIPDMSITTN